MNFNLSDFFENFWNQYGHFILGLSRKLVITILVILGGMFVMRLSRRLIRRSVNGKIKTDESLAHLLETVIKYGVVIICLIMILDTFGVSTAGLITVLGTAGIAIGFALRDTLSNIAAGIILIILKPFRKGDFIECGSISGTVKKFGLFSTEIETPDGIFIFAPNSNFWGISLRNYSRNSKRRMDITVNISFNDSIDAAFSVLSEIIKQETRFLKNPPPQVMVQSLGVNGVGVTLRAWVSTDLYWQVYNEQMKTVKEKMQEAKITIAATRSEIRLVK